MLLDKLSGSGIYSLQVVRHGLKGQNYATIMIRYSHYDTQSSGKAFWFQSRSTGVVHTGSKTFV